MALVHQHTRSRIGAEGIKKITEWISEPEFGEMRQFEVVADTVRPAQTQLHLSTVTQPMQAGPRRQLSRVEKFLEQHAGWNDLCSPDGGIGSICEQLLGRRASLFKEKVMYKGPGGQFPHSTCASS
jgi:hypothetical protein